MANRRVLRLPVPGRDGESYELAQHLARIYLANAVLACAVAEGRPRTCAGRQLRAGVGPGAGGEKVETADGTHDDLVGSSAAVDLVVCGGVTPDEKLWSEFDPELVATFRQTRQEAGNA